MSENDAILLKDFWTPDDPVTADNEDVPRFLKDIWKPDLQPMDKKYRVHFATRNKEGVHPLDVWLNSEHSWKAWQESRPYRNGKHVRRWSDAKRIFSVIQLKGAKDCWLYAGTWNIDEERKEDYRVTFLRDQLEGRLVLYTPKESRRSRRGHFGSFKFKRYYTGEFKLEVWRRLSKRYAGETRNEL